jgi:indolepyruvate ferredoxin oxidoreductase alpha subunit
MWGQAVSGARGHDVLRDEPGARAAMLGNVAIVRGALEAGVQYFACYPGTPSSEVGDTFAAIAEGCGISFEYSVNEKIALELAFGASLSGARSMCSMKHLGLNYAGDPASTIPYVGVEGGMVIVSAGDPSAITSPNEQDQRHFSNFLFYPIFDPATVPDALAMTRFAFRLSEETRLPVILRPTTRVCHTSSVVELGQLATTKNKIVFNKDPARYTPMPANARRMRKEITQRYQKAAELLASSPFFGTYGSGSRGIVASGVGYAYARQIVEDLGLEDTVSLMQIGAYPIPEPLLGRFLKSVDSVLIVEELTPFVEERVMISAFRLGRNIPITGKHTGHFPMEFEYGPDMVEDAIRSYLDMPARPKIEVSQPALPIRPPVLCPGCPHRSSFYLVRKAFGKKTVYTNDIGCYTLGYGPPLECCDTVLSMGSSISEAAAIAQTTGKRTVAFLGDSTFFHSGLPALANLVVNSADVTVVVLNNHVTAMTGFQPSVAAAADGSDESGLSILRAVKGLGVKNVHEVDPTDEDSTLAVLRAAKKGSGVNVVICSAPCSVYDKRLSGSEKRAPLEVDQELCNQCSLCVLVLGCPAIEVTDNKYEIVADLCDGCRLCAYVCNQDAIKEGGE